MIIQTEIKQLFLVHYAVLGYIHRPHLSPDEYPSTGTSTIDQKKYAIFLWRRNWGDSWGSPATIIEFTPLDVISLGLPYQ